MASQRQTRYIAQTVGVGELNKKNLYIVLRKEYLGKDRLTRGSREWQTTYNTQIVGVGKLVQTPGELNNMLFVTTDWIGRTV